MKNLNLLRKVVIKLSEALVIIAFCFLLSCSKDENIDDYPTNSILQDDIIENTTDKSTIDCKITEWYNDFTHSVNFTWDDANITHDLIDKVFERYNFHATYFIQTAAFNISQYIEMYIRISNRGNEIASHTVNHYYLKDIPILRVENELKSSSDDINSYFGYYPATFAHPGSVMNTEIDELVNKYYLSSRYSSIINTSDRSFWGFRAKQTLRQMKDGFNLLFSKKQQKWIIFAGHGVNGIGYEPINIDDLDSLLCYLKTEYSEHMWLTTFANTAMYKFLRENIKIEYGKDFVFFNRNKIKEQIHKYSNAECIITVRFSNCRNIVFSSEGIIGRRTEGNDQIISLDLRKSRLVNFTKTQ